MSGPSGGRCETCRFWLDMETHFLCVGGGIFAGMPTTARNGCDRYESMDIDCGPRMARMPSVQSHGDEPV